MQASGRLAELLAILRNAEGPSVDPPARPVEPAAAPPGAEPPPEPATPAIAPVETAAGPDQAAALETAAEPGRDGQPSDRRPTIFVTTTAVNYREAPSIDARVLGTLASGARLRVLGQDRGWAQVRLGDGRPAYVATEFLEPAARSPEPAGAASSP
jgi:hypothetical protein